MTISLWVVAVLIGLPLLGILGLALQAWSVLHTVKKRRLAAAAPLILDRYGDARPGTSGRPRRTRPSRPTVATPAAAAARP
jgi:hypothetical protein